MSKEGIGLGAYGEDLAVNFLKESGYIIRYRNYKTKLGEIDIIAEDSKVLCFIEVKTRSSERFGFGTEAVSSLKQKQIAKAALSFLKERKLLERKARFDVVSVDCSLITPRLALIKDAFDLPPGFTY